MNETLDIHIIGGGPAGLYLAYLLKRDRPNDRVRVMERNRADVTYGWGVVFSGRALSFIEQRTSQLFDSIELHLERWSDLSIFHQNEAVRIDGSQFSGISRQRLLTTLQHYCESVGVELHFSSPQSALIANDTADLTVGADGVNSFVRGADETRFQTSKELCSNYYIWYGTSQVFDTLSLIFKANSDGAFVAHSYRYSPEMSTFLVECDAQTFARAGLSRMTDSESRSYCEKLFSSNLNGEKLRSNQSSWQQFPVIKNRHWFQNNTVLIGDALRTVHFSIGSGTRTALQDAIVLADSISSCRGDLARGLNRFVDDRRDEAQKIDLIASQSIRWYEEFHRHMALAPYDFAMSYMLRGGKLKLADIEAQAPIFAKQWQEHGSDNLV